MFTGALLYGGKQVKFKSKHAGHVVFNDGKLVARFSRGKFETTDQKIQKILKDTPGVEKVEEKEEE